LLNFEGYRIFFRDKYINEYIYTAVDIE